MENTAFKQFVENYTTVSIVEWEKIINCFEKKIVEKDEMILQQGKICKYLYFLETGLLRFFITKDGNEIIKFFTDAPYCFTSQYSFNNQIPATENIQAIETSIVWQISLAKSNELLTLKTWSNFAKKIIQEVQFLTEEILEDIQTETAEARYEKMLIHNPNLLSRLPLKYLASYLGIAPQSLSRIRKKIAKKKRT